MKELIKLENKLNKQLEKALKNDNFELAGNISNQLDLVYEKQLQLKLFK
jgi:hypothetical protein